MKYEIKEQPNLIWLSVEASFTLIDFLLFFTSFLLGFVFALFFLIFCGAVFLKLFTRYEFEINTDTYEITQYYKIFSYLRIRLQVLSFGDVQKLLLSNYESGKALYGKGMTSQEWYTLDIITKTKPLRIVKAYPDELGEIQDLFEDLKERTGHWFKFEVDWVAFSED